MKIELLIFLLGKFPYRYFLNLAAAMPEAMYRKVIFESAQEFACDPEK